ncbi:MAG: pyrroline-5-carboxylate reductase [Gammaproteobacteria bacterium]
MKNTHIAFIGGGNMASSLIGGLIADGCAAHNIWVADPDAAKLAELKARFSVNTTHSNQQAAAQAQTVILAVKPQALRAVAQDLAATVKHYKPLVISIAAGLRISSIDAWLGGAAAIVRAMPNTPALVQSGATALYANALVSADQHGLAESILRAVGMVLWLDDEAQMDAVTALSGSGPAYFFLVMEVLENAAVRLGLARNDARLLTLQTAFGAAKMALESAEHSAALRARVTSKGGTTERAVQVLQEGGIQDLFDEALQAGRARSDELAILLGAA